MESMISLLFSAYLSQEFDSVVPKYQQSDAEEKFYEVWQKLNNGLTYDEQHDNEDLLMDSNYESDKRTFCDAFRIGLLLGLEVGGHDGIIKSEL